MSQAVTQQTVETAIQTLNERGQFVTVRGIRDVLGVGSFTTISKYLKKIDKEQKISTTLNMPSNKLHVLTKLLSDIEGSVKLAKKMSLPDKQLKEKKLQKISYTRICYLTTCSDRNSKEKILSILRKQDPKQLDISGYYLYSEGEVLQVFEGQASNVIDFYQLICNNNFNSRNKILFLSKSSKKVFDKPSTSYWKSSESLFFTFFNQIKLAENFPSRDKRSFHREKILEQLNLRMSYNSKNIIFK